MHNSAINYIHVNMKKTHALWYWYSLYKIRSFLNKMYGLLYFESDILWSQSRANTLVTIRLHYPWLWSYGTQSCPSLVCNQKRMLHSETQYFFCSLPTKALFLSLLPLEIMIKMKNLFQHYEGKMFLVRM